MIGQYLSNTNERATVSILENILELNKDKAYITVLALDSLQGWARPTINSYLILGLVWFTPKTKKFLRFSITSNLAVHA